MGVVDELKELQQLRDQGMLTEDEFTRAKMRVIGGEVAEVVDAAVSKPQSIDEVLAAVDKKWEVERKDYVFRDGRGRERIPTKAMAVGWCAFACGIGFLALAEATTMRTSPMSLLPALGGLVATLASAFSTYDRADKYERAYAAYLQRRLEALLSDRLRTPTGPISS